MKGRRAALSFIFVTLVIDLLGIGLIVPILPSLVDHLHQGDLSNSAVIYGSLAALYGAMQFLFSPVLGALSDRFGRRPVVLISLLGGGLDYFLLAFAPSLAWFFVARMISGISGANISAATAYIADISPPEKRAANFGIVGAAFGLGFAVGPAIGGLLGSYDLRLPFIAAGCLTLLNFLYGYFILPESLAHENRRAFQWKRANPVSALLQLGSTRAMLAMAAVYFLYHLAHQVYQSTWVLYTVHRYSWSPLQIGLSLSFVGVMAAIVQGGLTRRIIPRLGEQRAVLAGLLVNALAFAAYAFAATGPMVYLIITFGSLGAIANPAIQGILSRSVGDSEQGRLHGSLNSLYSVTAVLGPTLHTTVFAYFIGRNAPLVFPGASFMTSVILVLGAAGLSILAFRKHSFSS